MEFEPTITKFCSDALTDWAIRQWLQVALRTNFVHLLHFHLFVKCSRFVSVFAFVSRHICFKGSLAQVITLLLEWYKWYSPLRIFTRSYRKLAWVRFEPTTTELRSDFVQLLQFHGQVWKIRRETECCSVNVMYYLKCKMCNEKERINQGFKVI